MTLAERLKLWKLEFPSPKSRLPKLLAEEIDNTVIIGFDTRAEKIYALINGLTSRPTCIMCGGHINYHRKFSETCSLSCAAKNPKVRAKTIRTTLDRYGVDHHSKSESTQTKTKETNLARYGYASSSSSTLIKEKIAFTNIQKYGNICSLNSEESIKKKRATWKDKRGVDNPAKCSDVQERKRRTIIESTDKRKQSYLAMFLENGITPLFSTWVGVGEYDWRHICGTEFKSYFVGDLLPRCPVCFPAHVSKEEILVREMIPSSINYLKNDRSLLDGRELDIYLPDHQLAIEVNGMFWHHDGRDHLFPLLKKTQLAADKNVQVLHFWDYEVLEKPEIVKNIILSKLGCLPRIGARTLELEQIQAKLAAEFLNKTHLAGFARAKYHFALKNKNEILAVASFGKHRFGKSAWELIRYASVNTVQGGLSKFIKHFRKYESGKLISYADRRFSVGKAYQKLGFYHSHNTRPNYFYFRGQRRLQRQQVQRHRILSTLGEVPIADNEYDTMLLNGWNRCTDCGSAKYELD